MSESVTRKILRAWPFLTLATLLVVFVLMLTFSRKAPFITNLEPAMAEPGQLVVVTGDYFGRTEREGTLSLAGEIPPPSLIQSWTDQEIVFMVPPNAPSGLVMVTNSQGTSTGVLFTNTESIPTVLQAASKPGQPLLLAIVPPLPISGQIVTLLGRGFGGGDEAVEVVITTTQDGPTLEIGPQESLSWTDRSVSFRLPAGVTSSSSVRVITPRGDSGPLSIPVVGPMMFESPRTLTVDIQAKFKLTSGSAALWLPVPQRTSGTRWALVSSDPTPLPEVSPPVVKWAAGIPGERRLVYRLTLTTWARRWDGFPAMAAGTAEVIPSGDPRPKEWWKPANQPLKTLTAKWGLETSDPWLRLQRLQTGLAGLQPEVKVGESFRLERTPAEVLASPGLNSLEVSSLAVALASSLGIPGHLVSGLWLNPEGKLVPRTWTEVWLAGAGWIPWDVIDGNPGSLDNRHFAFETVLVPPVRREPRSTTFGPPAPFSLGNPAGEVSVTGEEPLLEWQITVVEK